jgi:hypothetical protein
MKNKVIKRHIKDVESEVKALRKQIEQNWPKRKFSRCIPSLMGAAEMEARLHLAWLQGYLRAMRDERGLQ